MTEVWLKPGERNEKPVFLFVEVDGEEALYTSVSDRDTYTTEEWRHYYGMLAQALAPWAYCCNCGKPLITDAEFTELAPNAHAVKRWRFCAVVHHGEIKAFYCWECAPPRSKRAFLLAKYADH
ncbi:hypothetical protein [Pyrobaculum aerophilum]|nr:hypothetical protein [Pyrobaculum aerophilum]